MRRGSTPVRATSSLTTSAACNAVFPLTGSISGYTNPFEKAVGIVWARTDRPARMLVEAATSDSFRDIIAGTCVDALPESDFTAKVLLEELPAGAEIFYRVQFRLVMANNVFNVAKPHVQHGFKIGFGGRCFYAAATVMPANNYVFYS